MKYLAVIAAFAMCCATPLTAESAGSTIANDLAAAGGSAIKAQQAAADLAATQAETARIEAETARIRQESAARDAERSRKEKAAQAAANLISAPGSRTSAAVPNLGDQSCESWKRAHASGDGADAFQYKMLTEVWLWGYLRGMADQWAFSTKSANPLVKLVQGEDVTWVSSYCQVFPNSRLSGGALALLVELTGRK